MRADPALARIGSATVHDLGSFDISVVLPLSHDHGFGEACLDAWNAQSHPRERIQIVAVVEAHEAAALEARLRPRLRPWDLWLSVDDDNDAVLYDRGARAADAALLLFSEAHCVPAPRAAAAAMEALGGGASAFCLRSGYLPTSALGRRQVELEATWYGSLGPGHWRGVSLRGLAMRRDLYVELGGFRVEHEHFCEMALGAALHLGGHRFVRSEEVLVLHGNAPTTAELGIALRSCGRGEWRWREEMERRAPGLADELLGPPTPTGRIADALARRSWARGSVGAAARGLTALRSGILGLACHTLVSVGPLGRWAYRAYWRAAFDSGVVEAATAPSMFARQTQSAPAVLPSPGMSTIDGPGGVAPMAGSAP
ncbi:MAG TPA: hypothetical protein VGS57_05125 [Thermoanaerobaculia bacterium]|jgi:hypothetical protein|nr:hypothetical protein [Thermoanaerobaculia bacterium]